MPDPDLHTQQFLACRTCLRLERVLPRLLVPDDEGDEPFAARHAGHRLEPLTRLGDAFLSDRPAWDPLATTYFEVTNGSEVLIVRSGRRSIEEPVERVLLPGRLRLERVSVEFETELIQRALDAHFFPHALRPGKVERFLSILDDLCRRIDAVELEVVFDSADEPHVHYARLPRHLREELRARCEATFGDWERERLRGFLAQADADDGLFTLRVTRSFVLDAA